MNRRITTHLNMIRACLKVAEGPEFKSVWASGPPTGFRTEIAQAAAEFEAVATKGGLADTAANGGGDAKAAARTALEESTHMLGRALALHFLRTGDLDRRGKVNFTRSKIHHLRAQELVQQATTIRDLAAAVVAEPEAESRGISVQLVEEHSATISRFSSEAATPRSQIANRIALLREVRSDVDALVRRLQGLDDLIVQFARTPMGRRFVAAWRAARVIVDSGGGSNAVPTPDSTPEASPSVAQPAQAQATTRPSAADAPRPTAGVQS